MSTMCHFLARFNQCKGVRSTSAIEVHRTLATEASQTRSFGGGAAGRLGEQNSRGAKKKQNSGKIVESVKNSYA